MTKNNPISRNFKTPRSHAEVSAIGAMEIFMEIIMNRFPTVTRSDVDFHRALHRLADFLHERDLELETDLRQQLTPTD